MRAIQIDRFGGPEELHLVDIPIPEPGPNQVLIREAFASINPADWKSRAGLLPHLKAFPFPMTLGMDCSGIVERVGLGVSEFKPGDRVVTLSGMGLGLGGTYAEYCCAPAPRVAHLPPHLDFAEGATIPIASASAASSILDVAKCGTGDIVFVNGGAGSVGTFAIQFLKHLGASVAATCSTGNVEYVRGLGADLVIDYTRQNICSALHHWAPKGIDAAIDAIGQHSLPREMPTAIKEGGVLVCITNLLTGLDAFDLDAAAKRNVRVVDNVVAAMTEEPTWFQVSAWRRLLDAIGARHVDVPPYKILPLENVGEGQVIVAEGHVRGKILLEIARLF